LVAKLARCNPPDFSSTTLNNTFVGIDGNFYINSEGTTERNCAILEVPNKEIVSASRFFKSTDN
jgi:hypothetical protein